MKTKKEIDELVDQTLAAILGEPYINNTKRHECYLTAKSILRNLIKPNTLPAYAQDDLVRSIGIIALSGHPLPPEIVNGNIVHKTGYTAKQHEVIVKRCQEVMRKHGLYDYWATTDESGNLRVGKEMVTK